MTTRDDEMYENWLKLTRTGKQLRGMMQKKEVCQVFIYVATLDRYVHVTKVEGRRMLEDSANKEFHVIFRDGQLLISDVIYSEEDCC